jgi:hypothetical protein
VETGIILVGAFYLLSFLFALIFVYYSFKIYTKSYTFNLFVKWILSYLLSFSMWLLFSFYMSLAYGYPISLKSVLEVALVLFEILLPFVILFYLLRIEERGFDYKYLKGIFISFIFFLVPIIYNVFNKPQISFLHDYFDACIHSIYFILSPLFVIYIVKIVYNALIENKRIKYPIILLGLLISILLTGSIVDGIYKSLNLIYNLIIAILGLSFFIYLPWLEKLCTSDSKIDNKNQNDKEYSILNSISKEISARKKRFFNIEVSIEKSEYALNDEVRNAITNSKYLCTDNRDLNQIKFMLVCATQEAENLKNESNTAHNWKLTGFTLMLVPSILILNSFVNYLFNLQINSFITSLSFLSILDQILSRFDNSTHVLILILLLYLLLFKL